MFAEAGAGLGGPGVLDFAHGGDDDLAPVYSGFGVAGAVDGAVAVHL